MKKIYTKLIVLIIIFPFLSDAYCCINPIASFEFSPTNIICAGSNVDINANNSYDPDGYIYKWEWDWNGDDIYDDTFIVEEPWYFEGQQWFWSPPYNVPGSYTIKLRVTDYDELTATTTRQLIVIGGPIKSLDSCGEPYGKLLLLRNPQSDSPLDYYTPFYAQPTGTTYQWEITDTNKAQIVGSSTGATLSLKAKQEGDFSIKLTYSNGGKQCISYMATSVQKPSQAHSYVQCEPGFWYCAIPPSPPYMSAGGNVHFYIRDSSGRPVQHAFVDESWVGGCVTIQQDATTDCNGHVPDHIEIVRYWYCDSRGVICTDTQTGKVAGWPVSGNFWTYNITFYDGQPPQAHPYVAHSGCQ